MKKGLVIFLGLIIILAGCSKSKQLTNDLTGTWIVYKATYNNVEDQALADSLLNYSVTFTSNGQYTTQNIFGTDTLHTLGTWQFQNSYSQLVFTDTSHVQTTYTMLNLTGNSVELLRNGYDRYMRKNQ
jgi:hypothetical protein